MIPLLVHLLKGDAMDCKEQAAGALKILAVNETNEVHLDFALGMDKSGSEPLPLKVNQCLSRYSNKEPPFRPASVQGMNKDNHGMSSFG